MKYCLQVNNYKYVTALNFEVMPEKINVDRTCSQKENTSTISMMTIMMIICISHCKQ